jgi:hypothetical protein
MDDRRETDMKNREKALQIANDAIEQIEAGGIMPDTSDSLNYALVLILADIGQRLDDISDALWSIRSDGIGVGG